jgi:type IV secretory pathway TrbD component
MNAEPEFHPVYKALIRRPETMGVDQRFVLVGPAALVIITILGRFSLGGFLFGLVTMAACHVAGRWMYAHEPEILRMLWRAWWHTGRYDPLKHEPVYLEVVKTWTPSRTINTPDR